MKAKLLLLIFALSWVPFLEAQSKINRFLEPSDTLNLSRKRGIMISEITAAGLGLVGLNQLWYADFERSSFKSINDGDEWMKIDKLGHVFSAYQLNRLASESLAWSGASKEGQLIYGSALSLGFLTTVEIFDGFSEEWGFSWHDFGANFLGSTIYTAQELLWSEQRALIKYSFRRSDYASLNPSKLGDSYLEELFKDYNGQTYWLSLNLRSFFKNSGIPPWLNLALGYGGEGMLTGVPVDPEGIFVNQDRYVQYYLSLDIDLSRIRTNSNVLKTVFSLFNTLKVPLPTVEFSSRKNPVFRLFY